MGKRSLIALLLVLGLLCTFVYAQVRERYVYPQGNVINRVYELIFDEDDFEFAADNTVLIPAHDPNKIVYGDPNGNPTTDPNLWYDPGKKIFYVTNIEITYIDTNSMDVNDMTIDTLTASRLVASNASRLLVSTDAHDWITGTANRVTVTDDTDGTITLTTPQDIHTGASPTFVKTTLTGNEINIATSQTPASGSAAGTAGDIAWDTDYIYVAVASNTWKRAALTTWGVAAENVVYAGENVIFAAEQVVYP